MIELRGKQLLLAQAETEPPDQSETASEQQDQEASEPAGDQTAMPVETEGQKKEKTEEPTKQIDATWKCETRAIDSEPSVALDNLYVGDKYLVHCQGEFVEGFATEQAAAAYLNEAQTYTIHILKMRTFENKEFWAEATSYKPGEHKFDGVIVSDGLQRIALTGEQPVVVKSALAERPQVEAMNPNAQKIMLMGPFPLALPIWLWIAIFVVVFGLVGLIWRTVAMRMQKRRLLEELAKHNTALTSYNQFHKEIRTHIRNHTGPTATNSTPTQYVRDLDSSFRMFLVREFLIPAMEWKTSTVMGELKGRHKKTYRYAGPQVRKLLVEFDRAKDAGEKMRYQDCEQLIEMSRRVVNQIKKMRRVTK
ncbi:MAG: hypothetical protein HRT45_10305 [Bdellovibrionales bacterium]|nr:hypothetical protein [Bdellovibrionales bacterium]